MPDLRDRLRDLDSLVVPDVMERARQIGPKTPMKTSSGVGRRLIVAAIALLLAVASFAYLSRSFERSDGPTPGGPQIQPSAPCAFSIRTMSIPPGAAAGRLIAGFVAGTSLEDLWVLGSTKQKNQPRNSELLHYDGTTWRDMDLPADRSVSSLVAPAPGTVWGIASNGVAQWDGATWTRTLRGSTITDLDVESSDSVWATGSVYDVASRTSAPSVMHWDGSDWTTSYRAGGEIDAPSALTAVSAWSPDDVWVAGVTTTGPLDVPVALHWDGMAWSSRMPGSLDPVGHMDVVAVGPDDALMTVDKAVLRWDTAAWFDAGFKAPSSMDIPLDMGFGDAGVWAKVWNTSVGRWDGGNWRVEGLRDVYAYGMSVIGGDAVFVGHPGLVEIYSCDPSTLDLSA